MSAPYMVDPNKSGAPNAPGWVQPNPPSYSYPQQPAFSTQPGYMPQAPYPMQPGYGEYPPQTGFMPMAPPAYGIPAGYAQPAQVYPLPGQANQYYGGMYSQPFVTQPAYNASSGSFPIQPGMASIARGPEEPKDESLPEQFGSSFGDKAIRHSFIRKVYMILMLQLAVTVGIVCLFSFHDGVRLFVRQNIWVYFMSYGFFLVTYLTLVCCSSVRRKWPANFIMLAIFTLALSYMTGTISSMYDNQIVLMTLGITCAICFCLMLFAIQTKFDFTGCGTYLFVASLVLLIFGIVAIFTYSKIMHTIYSAGIALLFSMYLVYDTQQIVGGRKHEMSPEEHIYGALQLYLDIVMIFTALLSLFGSAK